MFMSRNQMSNSYVQKKDDLDSLLYVIWWVYNDQKLAWSELDKDAMDSFKYNLNIETLCDISVDDDIYSFFKVIFETGSDRRISFDYLIDIIRTVQDKYALPRDDKRFCWNLKNKITDKLALGFSRMKTMNPNKKMSLALPAKPTPMPSKTVGASFFVSKVADPKLGQVNEVDFERVLLGENLVLEESAIQKLGQDQKVFEELLARNLETNAKEIEDYQG